MSGAASTNDSKWIFSTRWIEGQIDRATWRNTLTYSFHPRLRIGIEYNPLADEVAPIANVLLLSETEMRPAIVLGTSSDRIGTPDGQSIYGTLSKDLTSLTGLPIAPYVGTAYSTYEERFRAIAGANIDLPKNFSSLLIFDGVHFHPTLSYTHGRHVFSFLLVSGHHPGLSYSISF